MLRITCGVCGREHVPSRDEITSELRVDEFRRGDVGRVLRALVTAHERIESSGVEHAVLNRRRDTDGEIVLGDHLPDQTAVDDAYVMLMRRADGLADGPLRDALLVIMGAMFEVG